MDDLRDMYDLTYGSTMTHIEIAERFGIEEDEVAELMLEENLEMCDECGTWVECGEIVLDDDENPIGCNGCQ